MKEKLKNLGLSSYEAKVFLALCERGPLDGRSLSKISGVPLGRIYDVLRELESKGAVYVQNSRPKIYAVPDVERAIENILSSKIRGVEREISEIRTLAEELKRELKPRKFEERRTFWSLAMGREKGIDLIIGKLESVENSLLNVLTPSELQLFKAEKRKFARMISKLFERNVEIKLIAPPGIAEEHGLKAPDLRIVDGIHPPFTVIDAREALIKVENPARRGEILGVLYMNDPNLARELSNHFLRLWENGREP